MERFSFCSYSKEIRTRSKTFPYGQAVECEGLTHEKHNVDEQLKKFIEVGVYFHTPCGGFLAF